MEIDLSDLIAAMIVGLALGVSIMAIFYRGSDDDSARP